MNQDQLARVIEELKEHPTNHENWAQLHRLIWPFIMARMYRGLGGSRYLAEEASQEVLMRMVRAFDFRDSDVTVAKFLKYLGATCRSVLIDLRRMNAQGRDASNDDPTAALDEAPDLEGPSPEERAVLLDMLEKFTRDLPLRERQVTYLLFEGRSAREIAEITGIAQKTVENLISVVRQKFRATLFSPRVPFR